MMGSFLQAYGGTILVGLAVLAIVAAAVVKLYRDRRKGQSSCGCGCDHCASSGICHKH
ncbi:MAG: FeoB-associated Cys-rich membrane protein [Christensenellales bacterium]